MTQFTVNPHRFDPYKNFKVKVKWDGRYVAGVSKVSALRRTTEVITHREGGDPSLSHRSPGRTTFEPITLERGVTHDVEFERWANKVWDLAGAPGQQMSLRDFRKDLTIERPAVTLAPRAPPRAASTIAPMTTTHSLYDAIGGQPAFRKLVARFYAEVAADELLRALYPEEDLGPAEERLRLFLMQYWGGPTTYSDERGHPRLRMRHAGFRIGPAQRDAWLRAMRVALDESDIAEPYRTQLWDYLQSTAQHMINSPT